ncbi:serine/threonine protein kinase, AGC family [Trichoderma atroviride IMI 206040]|uniref:non-specific serine/threonine protein kinase n=1 Tax=Hypocrea atroviridis (strain ATCC 20476 / IMI 206040) TaxID=452589 RepID=G9P316_HYPAI|nr:serine/threonine protein kinase, AGC family [Trichoderma atroviride IMI 206040]EHK43607.1 serine/threonine protein kinase, AGC family [Trichoderma atroviride IMI 206040]
MASFMSTFFPGSSSARAGDAHAEPRPVTPTMNSNSFINPLNTPLGSPSKRTMPPGANDLPTAFDAAMNLNLGSNEEEAALPLDGSVVQKKMPKVDKVEKAEKADKVEKMQRTEKGRASPGSPRKRHAQPAQAHDANAPPVPRLAQDQDRHPHHSHAALSRQQMYDTKGERPIIAKRFNTARGLTAEEREILQRPNVRRMVNVTQLYFLDYYFDLLTYVGARQKRLAAFKSEFPASPETDPETHRVWSKYTGRERANLRKRRIRLKQGDFQILTQVGQGGYGQVFLAQKKDTREVCALKVMSKKLLFKLDEVRHVLTERDILTTAQSDWLVRLLYSFQDDKNIYLAMEYVPGGDFRTLLNNTGVLSNRHARFYIAEMFCSVDALHKLGYIHRDLKPENFLVDSTGHVKLTDFGLAAGVLAPSKIESMRIKLEQASETPVPFGKPIGQRTVAERRESYRTMRDKDVNYAKSIVGSPDYMAPEVLRGEEYDYTVDYWSLGCMLFEALTGFPPFAGSTPDETWRNLKHWKEVLKRPVWEDPNYFLSNRTWNFITTCINSRTKRFSEIKDIFAHHYFAEVDWETLRQTRAPFVPELDSETDAGYFDDFGSDADMAKYKEVHDKQQALESMAEREEEMSKSLFVGFTFRHRKPATDDGDGSNSPRKRIPTDDSFGTMF